MFYCNNCNAFELDSFYDSNKHRNINTWSNCRDGYGRGIQHIICPNCGDPLSGFINTQGCEMGEEEIEYFKDTLRMYQIEDGYLHFRKGDRFETIDDLKKDMINKVEERNKQEKERIEKWKNMTEDELLQEIQQRRI